MAYAEPPATPQARPATVTIASSLLYLLAILQIIAAIVSFATLSATKEAVLKVYANNPNADTAAAAIAAVAIAEAVLWLLLAAGFVVLGVLNGKGRNPARITTWVLGGLALCCFGVGLASTLTPGALNFGSPAGTDAPSGADLARAIEDGVPSWVTPISLTLQTIELMAVIAVVILLALPASNAYFRRRPPQFGDPAYPSAPPPPGA